MNIVKTLALAGVTALSLGAGAAMAQTVVPGTVYQPNAYAPNAANQAGTQVQSGSSDVQRPSMFDGSGARTDSAYYVGGGSG